MFEYHLEFDYPWYLLLLGLVPLLWWFSYRSLAGLGQYRRLAALAARTAVLVLLVLAISGARWARTSERLTVIYLLDQSLSIPDAQRQAMTAFVNEAIRRHRQEEDRAGVVVFGREAAIEIPPFDEDVQLAEKIETLPDPEYTNLAGALKLAQASFPEDTAKRIVVISDGNENLGSALEQARGMVEAAGISIDVLPIRYSARAEVVVEKVAIPSDVRKGQPFDLRVVVNNTTQPTNEDRGVVSGQLIIRQQTDDEPIVLSQQPVRLEPGKRVFSLRQEIEQPAFYTYEAQFVPDDPRDDAMPQNNRATAFSHVRGSGQVLLIEDHENRGEHALLVDRLRSENIEVTVRASDQLFNSLAELQQFDTVILANVPRSSGSDAASITHFTDAQIDMLVRNTEVMGCGLIMLGGPNSFGAGGWTNTALEKAMPVDFEIKSARVVPKGALALIMHASELADGNHWQKVIAAEAIKALGSQDYCGLLHWDGTEKWLWNHPRGLVTVGPNRNKMLAYLDRMAPGDMPDFDPTLKMALREFERLPDAAVKHMIIISDGDPSPPSRGVIRGLREAKVTVSTVAVGTHGPANSAVLRDLAGATGGKYYEVRNNNALPRIFQREARRVARPLIYENSQGFAAETYFPHEMLSGVRDLPPLTGFVMTSVKQNPLVEVSLVSTKPDGGENNTLLASWTYGLGKAVAFTSDAGARWTAQWADSPNYNKLFSQMVRWSMRPVGDPGKFSVATDVVDGQVRVIVTALDKDDQYINLLNMTAAAVGPDMGLSEVKMEQIAPGRYLGSFNAKDSGSYFLMVNPGPGHGPIQTGINVPYSAEFLDRETNEPLLATLASLAPKGGAPGKLIEATGRIPDPLEELLQVNSFRHDLPKATTSQEAWYFLAFLATCLFFSDVFLRRVTVSFAWVPPLAAGVRDRVLGREREAPKTEYMARLRSRKAEVSETIEQRRAAARFEPSPDAPATTDALGEELSRTAPSAAPKAARPSTATLTPEKEEESYTDRLLKAKKKVWEEREKKEK